MYIRVLPLLAALALAACSSNTQPAPAEAPKADTAAAAVKEEKADKAEETEQAEKAEKAEAPVGRPDEEGKVLITATADEFIPSRVEVKGGEKVTLVFLREVEKSCMNKVVFPSLDIEKELPVGEKVEIDVTAPESGTIAFQCPMGMGKSAIVAM